MTTFVIDSSQNQTLSSIPWEQVNSGDNIILSGLFRENLVIQKDGVTIKAGGPTEITGFRIASFGSIDGNNNYKSSVKWDVPYFVRINGVIAKHGASLTSLNPGEWYFEKDASGYLGYVYVNVNPSSNVIEIAVSEAYQLCKFDNRSNITIQGITFTGVRNGSGQYAVGGEAATNILVDHCTFTGCMKAVDFRGASTNCVASNNIVSYCGDGLDANSVSTNRPSNILYINNKCYGMYDNLGNYFMQYAVVTGTVPIDHEGIACTGAGNNIAATGNFVIGWVDNISFYSSSLGVTNWRIESNWMQESFDDGLQLSAPVGSSIASAYVIGNVFYRNGRPATNTKYAFTSPDTVLYLEFCNNTVYENANGTTIQSVAGKDQNNIYYENYAGGASAYHSNYASMNIANWTNWTVNDNMYFGSGGWRAPGGTYRNGTQFSLWKTDSGKDVSSSVTNPVLNAVTVKPESNSPVYGIGVKFWTNGRPSDYNKEPYPDVSIDLGAIQSKNHPFHPSNIRP